MTSKSSGAAGRAEARRRYGDPVARVTEPADPAAGDTRPAPDADVKPRRGQHGRAEAARRYPN